MSNNKFKYSFNVRIWNILSLSNRLFLRESNILIKNKVQSNDFFFYFVMLCHLSKLYLQDNKLQSCRSCELEGYRRLQLWNSGKQYLPAAIKSHKIVSQNSCPWSEFELRMKYTAVLLQLCMCAHSPYFTQIFCLYC